mmetsp:Transcript_34924/g.37827  ORF Transcript_34924/g.37827 Transcript_34924/m.37827 type:complete len:283 (-) Transcript_34924:4-852(-)
MTTIIAPPSSNIMRDSSSSTTTIVVPPSTQKRFLLFKRGEQQRRRKTTTQSSSPTRTTVLLSQALSAITGGGPHLASSMKQTTPTVSLPSLKSNLKSRFNNSNSNSNSNSNNNVHFAPHVHIQLISSLEDMTHEDKCSIWMQIEEHNTIRRSCVQLIESVEKTASENRDSDNNNNGDNGNGNDEKKKIAVEDLLCTRGLESHLPQPQNGQQTTSSHQHQPNRRKAIQHVVAVSTSKHCTHGYYDDQAIADVYHVIGNTQEFQFTAELMASQDRQDVELYLLE